MLVTLESLIDDNINVSDEVIDMESLEFDITNTIMECSELSMDINTYESALTVCNNIQMENDKNNIFKRFVENIKKLLKRVKDFIKNIIDTISYKLDKRDNDKKYNNIINRIQKSSESVFVCDFNKLVTELYEQKLTSKHIDDFITACNNYGTNCLKLLDQFHKNIVNDNNTDDVMQDFQIESDKFVNSIKNNPIYNTISKFNADGQSISTERYVWQTEKHKISKDELIHRVEWCRDIQLNVNKYQDTYKIIDKLSKDFDNIQFIYNDKVTDYIKLVNSIVHQINKSCYLVWDIFNHISRDDIRYINKQLDELETWKN